MKILKLEKHDYTIVYVNDNDNYIAYKRLGHDKWQIYRNNEWRDLSSFDELEKLFKEHEKSNMC